MSDLAALEQRALAELQACTDEAALRAWHTHYFGKQGEVPLALKRDRRDRRRTSARPTASRPTRSRKR